MTSSPFPPTMVGDFLPDFTAQSSVNPSFEFDAAAGRDVLLCFIGSARQETGSAIVDRILAIEPRLRAQSILIYFVTVDPADRTDERFLSNTKRLVAFWDADMSIHKLYGMIQEKGQPGSSRMVLRTGCFLGQRNLKLREFLASMPLDTLAARIERACKTLPRLTHDIPMQAHPPVLMVPDVFSAELCEQLIAQYNETERGESGFMRDVDGKTRGFLDGSVKRRRDFLIENPATLALIRRQFHARILPEIHKAFSFEVTHIERYLVGCYDESDRGHFKAHRDNGGPGTAHRRFAVTLNLNTSEYEGGELSFPEYGRHLYKPETGSAVVFSCSLLHEARPVTKGKRYTFIPFLYDRASAELRRKNQGFVDRSTPQDLGEKQTV